MLRKCVTDFKINCIVFRKNNNRICRNIIKGIVICILLLNYDILRKCVTDFETNCIVSQEKKTNDRFY